MGRRKGVLDVNRSRRRLFYGTGLTLAVVFTILVSVIAVTRQYVQRPVVSIAAARTDRNVLYGLYSGLGLLMDIHHPERANGYGIVLIPGSGWSGSPTLNATPLKNDPDQVPLFVPPLLTAGYTVFVINHRVAPRFHYPSALEDAARAVRFIRHNAADYKIDARRIGGMGYSSGANLVALLGVKPDDARPDSSDPIATQSARLQCVVAGATPADLTSETTADGYQVLTGYLGVPVSAEVPKNGQAHKLLIEASPLTYVTPDDAPMLFFSGDRDRLVPITNVRRMVSALQEANVRTKIIEIKGADHWPIQVPNAPDFLGATVDWFGECLTQRVTS